MKVNTGINFTFPFTPTLSNVLHKFCAAQGHPMSKCTEFPLYKTRIDRCKQLNSYIVYCSIEHKIENCPGLQDKLPFSCKECSLRVHRMLLCDIHSKGVSLFVHVYTNIEEENNLTLPTVAVTWCNGYRRWKWTRQHKFKSWTRLIAFHIALIPLGKV